MAVLVACDDSDPGRRAAEYAFHGHADEPITLLHVVNPERYTGAFETGPLVDWDEVIARGERRAEELFEELLEHPDAEGIDVTTDTIVGHPARGIVDYAEEHGFDHVVLGSHGRTGVSRVLLGSVAEQVVRRAPGTVTVVR
ncbi:universal stress protein [Halorarum salinum]|uniref:Universal stress protein n=1 Tax=Halorarum salinum TaxID=2743089 RepID=A0A7D5QIC5_9EURY|nr:universal stress protein [Halobaculum salinum]QLG63302.1 universal stress protein [Halobaculum salinum]